MNSINLESPEVQLVYKLGSLEALVTSSMKRLDDNILSIKTDMAANKAEIAKDIKSIGDRVSRLEDFKSSVIARVSAVAAVFVVGWAVFGRTVEDFFTRIFG